MAFSLTSSAFVAREQGADGGSQAGSSRIPDMFAMKAVRGGQNVSIPYSWSGTPADTRSFALALVDEASVAHHWVHWLAIDIPAQSRELAQGASGTSAMPSGARELRNSFGFDGYGGPQPPAGTGAHPYVATIYALDLDRLGVAQNASRDAVLAAVRGHVLATATCTGTFGR
jgi:Raf kinase inhibitor-like YbhB/YbcL family protein